MTTNPITSSSTATVGPCSSSDQVSPHSYCGHRCDGESYSTRARPVAGLRRSLTTRSFRPRRSPSGASTRSFPSGASLRNRPTTRRRPQTSRSSRARGAGQCLADPRSVSNDPKVARPRLKTIHCQGDGVGGWSGRPTVARTMDLAASLEVLQPSERLVFAQACGSRDHRGRERVGHLAQCRSQAIPTRLGLALLSLRLRRHDSGGIGRSGLGCGLTSYRRVVTEASSAAAAHDHRLTSGRADDLKPTPSAPRATDAAATPGALHLDPVRIIHRLSTVIIGRRSGTDGGSPVTASMAPRAAIRSASANRTRSSSADSTSGGEGESASSDAPDASDRQSPALIVAPGCER